MIEQRRRSGQFGLEGRRGRRGWGKCDGWKKVHPTQGDINDITTLTDSKAQIKPISEEAAVARTELSRRRCLEKPFFGLSTPDPLRYALRSSVLIDGPDMILKLSIM